MRNFFHGEAFSIFVIGLLLLFIWLEITLQEKKIKSCYRGDLEVKVVRNYGGTFREQQAVGWGRVQGKGSGGGEKTEGSRALLWTLNPTPRAKGRHCDLWGGTAWSKLSFSELALRQEEGLRAQFRSHAQSHTRVWTRGKGRNQRPALREEEPHFSAQLPGEKNTIQRSS